MRDLSRSLAVAAFVIVFCFAALDALAAQTKKATNTLDAAAPFEELLQITPSNSTEYDPPLRGCIIEDAGDLSLNMVKGDAAIGSSDVILSASSGQLVPAMIDQILLTSTTATAVCGR